MNIPKKGSGLDPFFVLLAIVAACSIGCGKKGPPLPPLVRLPEAPPGVVAERRASMVDVQLTIPASNTDGTRPADVSRVDVYAVTAPPTLSDADLLRYGTRIGSLDVKAPRNDDTVEADDLDTEIEPPEGPGLDQGVTVHVQEALGALTSVPAQGNVSRAGAAAAAGPVPLVGPPADVPSRTYAAVGVSRNGRRGPLSKRATVPLIAPPVPVARPDVRYDETSLTVTWTPVGAPAPVLEATEGADLLPSRPLVAATERAFAYNVYETKITGDAGTKLTSSPVSDPQFVDSRLAWGVERCYAVRTVETIAGLTLEGEAAEERCVTPVDTFPPAAPGGLQSAPSQGAINLIWDASGEKDLAGYVVLRGASLDALAPVTTSPIQAPTFRDVVPAGFHAFYAVRAVDAAGNVSALSSVMDETAR